MSNLNDFTGNQASRHIRTLRVQDNYGKTHGNYDEAKQQFTLHADTRLIKIINSEQSAITYISYTLDGSSPDQGGAWNSSSVGTPDFGKFIILDGVNSSNNGGLDGRTVSIKVNGGETFKYMRVSRNGEWDSIHDNSGFHLQEWGY